MVKNKCLPKKHHHLALGLELFSWKPDGAILGKGVRGISSRMKAQAQIEAKEKAKKLDAEGKQLEAARALLGRRGGLPTLRRDLLQLAALVHVEVGEKDTVEMIKQKIRPGAIDHGGIRWFKLQGQSGEAGSQGSKFAKASAGGHINAGGDGRGVNAVTPEAVAEMLSQQDVKFQTMMSEDGDGRSLGQPGNDGGGSGDLGEGSCRSGGEEVNPWMVHQELKKGIATMVSQAWQQHERDRRLVSRSAKEVLEVMKTEWTAIRFGDKDNPLVSEVYTNTQRVMKEASRRGHSVGTAIQ